MRVLIPTVLIVLAGALTALVIVGLGGLRRRSLSRARPRFHLGGSISPGLDRSASSVLRLGSKVLLRRQVRKTVTFASRSSIESDNSRSSKFPKLLGVSSNAWTQQPTRFIVAEGISTIRMWRAPSSDFPWSCTHVRCRYTREALVGRMRQ